MKLNQHEIATPLWDKLSNHYGAELQSLRARAENPILPQDERQGLLWRIYEIKKFLELAELPAPKGDGRKP